MPNYVAGSGCLNPKLVIVGESPGKHENESGIPFMGPTGRMLDDYLYSAGISRSEVYVTNVVKYQPPFNDLKKLHLINVTIEQSIEELKIEIDRIKPNCILAVGNLALQALTGYSGILLYRGSILRGYNNYKIVPTIHPAALFSRFTSNDSDDSVTGALDYTYSKLIQHDVKRAVDESANSNFDLPDRNLVVARNSLDLYRFFREYHQHEKCAVDIESINCIPVCIGFAFNKYHAISVPLLDKIGNIELTTMGGRDVIECWRLIDETLRRTKVIGHNYKYDDFKLGLFGFETSNVYSDTLIKTRVLFPELPDKKLSTVASLWTREPYYKEEGKEFKLGKSRTDQLLLYNAKDCAVEFEVDEAKKKI